MRPNLRSVVIGSAQCPCSPTGSETTCGALPFPWHEICHTWYAKKVLQQKCIDSWKYMKMFDDGWRHNMRRRIMRNTKTIFSMITHLRLHTERLCEIHRVCAICRWVCFANCYSLFWTPLATVVPLEAVKLLISLQIEFWNYSTNQSWTLTFSARCRRGLRWVPSSGHRC